MNESYYHLPVFGTLLNHFPGRPLALRDGTDSSGQSNESDDRYAGDEVSAMLMRARIRSGDYFATLATELDKMAQGLNAARAPEATELERIVTELLYLDENFRLAKK